MASLSKVVQLNSLPRGPPGQASHGERERNLAHMHVQEQTNFYSSKRSHCTHSREALTYQRRPGMSRRDIQSVSYLRQLLCSRLSIESPGLLITRALTGLLITTLATWSEFAISAMHSFVFQPISTEMLMLDS